MITQAPRYELMEDIRCNICDEVFSSLSVGEHVAGRNHSIKKKVAEFNEMNAQIKPSHQQDTSIVTAWIRNLHSYDFLSTGMT
ncbi:MAG: hypothetical protein MN733_30430 [Nitrososphaera sp.]|nr:hypothetical protein [Nitrososphaera sp.]